MHQKVYYLHTETVLKYNQDLHPQKSLISRYEMLLLNPVETLGILISISCEQVNKSVPQYLDICLIQSESY